MDKSKLLLQSCLKILAIRPRSRKEIEDYLKKKTSDPQLINQIINKLEQAKLIDDQQFAKWLVDSRSRSRPRGTRLLLHELKSKGIDISSLNSHLSSLDEVQLARQALQKKLPLWSKLSARDFRLKAGRFLSYRGFSWNTIERILKSEYND